MGVLSALEESSPFQAPADTLQNEEIRKQGKKLPGLVRGAMNAIPGVYASVAGAATAPLKLTGPAGLGVNAAAAGLAAAQGEMQRQALDQGLGMLGFESEGLTNQERLKRIGTEATLNASLELGGGLALRGAKIIGKTFMKGAIKATPEVVEAAIRERIPATQAGFKKLMNRMGELGARVQGKTLMAGARGVRWHPEHDVADPALAKAMEAIQGSTNLENDIAKLQEMRLDFIGRQGGGRKPIAPDEALTIRRYADDVAKPIYDKIAKKEPITGDEHLRAVWNKSLADELRGKINAIPGVDALNARLAELKGIQEAVWPEVKPRKSVIASIASRQSVGATLGGGAGFLTGGEQRWRNAAIGAGIGALAGTPQSMSLAAMLATNPAILQMLGRLPTAAGALYQGTQQ